MTRQIKFRAWDKYRNHMFLQGTPDLETLSSFAHCVLWNDEAIESGDLVLMQFTGLLDKHGKEIYEGDRVNYMESEYEIKWSDVNAGFWVGGLHWLNNAVAQDCEIIGNIYESK